MKKHKKAKKNGVLICALLAAAVLAAALLIITRYIHSSSSTEVSPTPPATAEPPAANEEETAYDIGSGLEITSIGRYAGAYVEDGSDDIVSDVCAITVKNGSDATLQYAKIAVLIGDESYDFELSTLPAGESAQLLELARKAAPSSADGMTAALTNVSFFETEPSLCTDVISIDAQDTAITITNISSSDIGGKVYVYYKYINGDVYIGGKTFRSGVDNLPAGQSITLYASRFSTANSKIMFVTYVP